MCEIVTRQLFQGGAPPGASSGGISSRLVAAAAPGCHPRAVLPAEPLLPRRQGGRVLLHAPAQYRCGGSALRAAWSVGESLSVCLSVVSVSLSFMRMLVPVRVLVLMSDTDHLCPH